MIEAAEELFVPSCIYNNTEGDADAKVRKYFKEPAWNYPVVRVVDAEGGDLIPRVADQWHMAGMTGAMTAGLEATKVEVPTYLALLEEEAASRHAGLETAVFGMY
ncbi:MAG: hypothetical protein ACI9D0_002105 [Bacteroidia bacterium]